MRLGAGDLAPQAGSEHELYRRSQQASQERLEMPATLRRAGSIARLFAGPEPHTMQFDLDALMNVQTACQSLEGTNVGPRARGIPGYDVRMPVIVWHTYLVHGRDPHGDSRPLGVRSRGPNVGTESTVCNTKTPAVFSSQPSAIVITCTIRRVSAAFAHACSSYSRLLIKVTCTQSCARRLFDRSFRLASSPRAA